MRQPRLISLSQREKDIIVTCLKYAIKAEENAAQTRVVDQETHDKFNLVYQQFKDIHDKIDSVEPSDQKP